MRLTDKLTHEYYGIAEDEAAELWGQKVRDEWMHDPGDNAMGQWSEFVYELQRESLLYLVVNDKDVRGLGDVMCEFTIELLREVRDWREYKLLEMRGERPQREEVD